jgi:hypothetical protein
MGHEKQCSTGRIRRQRACALRQHVGELGRIVERARHVQADGGGRTGQPPHVQVVVHHVVERVGQPREVADLFVVSAVARDKERDDDDIGDSLCGQLGDLILKPMGRSGRSHEVREFEGAVRARGTRDALHLRVPAGFAAMRNQEGAHGAGGGLRECGGGREQERDGEQGGHSARA